MKTCKHRNCDKEVTGRKQYCSDRCKYWENVLRKDEEKGMMPKKKRNKNWFWAYAGSGYSRSQGKRSGHMIVGAMTGIPVSKHTIKETNKENLDKHFNNSGTTLVIFGDDTRITKEKYKEKGLTCIFN